MGKISGLLKCTFIYISKTVAWILWRKKLRELAASYRVIHGIGDLESPVENERYECDLDVKGDLDAEGGS